MNFWGSWEWIGKKRLAKKPWRKGLFEYRRILTSKKSPKMLQCKLLNLRRVYLYIYIYIYIYISNGAILPPKNQNAKLLEHMGMTSQPAGCTLSAPLVWEGKMTILALEMEAGSPSTRINPWPRYGACFRTSWRSSIARLNFTHLHPKNFRVQIPIKVVSAIVGQCSWWPKIIWICFCFKHVKSSVQHFCFFGKAGKCKVDDETWMPTHQERVGTDVGNIFTQASIYSKTITWIPGINDFLQ